MAKAKLPPGIHAQADGSFRVQAIAGRGPGMSKEKRFPKGTGVREMTTWKNDTCTALRAAAGERPAGSLADELDRIYIPIRRGDGMPTIDQRAVFLRRWFAELGPTRTRAEITKVDIDLVLAKWRTAGLPWSGRKMTSTSARKYLFALQNFFTVCGGPGAANPCKAVRRPDDVDPNVEPRKPAALTVPMFDRILAAMPDLGANRKGKRREPVSKSKLRLGVMAFVGLPQKLIMGLAPEHIDWDGCEVLIRKRRKGGGVRPRTIQVSDVGMAALRAFAAGDAWGPFSSSALCKAFKLAAAKVYPGVHVYPYRLRHMFVKTMTKAPGADNRTTSRLVVHTSPATTAIYQEDADRDMGRRNVRALDREIARERAAAKRSERTGSADVLAFGTGTARRTGTKKAVNG